MSQLFAIAAAHYFGIDRDEVYSGGTEATAFKPRAIAALQRAGFALDVASGDNPHHAVHYAEGQAPAIAFSKKYDHEANPQAGFAAVMTCSQADASCPFVTGAETILPLHYDDPKLADGTPGEAAAYDGRARQIATELFYAFSRLGT